MAIFLLAAFFRFYGLNWDQDQHLHPDERFLTMVTNAISWPADFSEYLDTQTSPLNPHNRGYNFFVYGTFPLFFTKWVAEFLNKADYNGLTIVGRQLSALFDLGTVLLVFLIAKAIKTPRGWPNGLPRGGGTRKTNISNIGLLDNWIIGLFAAFIYAAMVLPIQLSHFFAVDTYLTFFITLSFYLLIKIINYPLKVLSSKFLVLGSLLGISLGLAFASKISAILFLPIIGLGLLIFLIRKKNFRLFFIICCLLSVVCYLTFRLAQPYVFATGNIFDITLNQKVLDNWKQVQILMKPESGYPPSVQWIGTKPLIFPFNNMVIWGLGLPLGIIALMAISYGLWVMGYGLIRKKLNSQLTTHNSQLSLVLLWILLLFFYQGVQVGPNIRYFHPIYPFLAIISGYFVYQVFNKVQSKFKARIFLFFVLCFLFFVLIYPFSFISIYTRPHSRVIASQWIYENIPKNSVIASEYWDDGLPLTLSSEKRSDLYRYVQLPIYDPDAQEKWKKIDETLSAVDYIILSSNRLWGSITKTEERYPIGHKYYTLLFDGSLGFEKVAEINSLPSLPLPLGKRCLYLLPPQEQTLGLYSEKKGFIRFDSCDIYQQVRYSGIVIRDENAEETFTVYDHPKILIFKKIKPVDYFSKLQ